MQFDDKKLILVNITRFIIFAHFVSHGRKSQMQCCSSLVGSFLKKKSCQISGQNNIVDIFVSFLSWGKTSQTTKIGSFLKRFYENVQALFRTNLRILFEADKKQRNWSIIQRVFAKCVKIISQKKMAEHVYDFSSVHNRNNRCWFYAEKNGTHTESRLHTSPFLWWMKPSCEIFYLVNCLGWYLFGFFSTHSHCEFRFISELFLWTE